MESISGRVGSSSEPVYRKFLATLDKSLLTVSCDAQDCGCGALPKRLLGNAE